MAVNGKGLAILGLGALFTFSGVKGWSILGTAQDLIMGVAPSQTQANPINLTALTTQGIPDTGAIPSVGATPGTASGLAAIALQYQGHRYVWAGAPQPDGSGGWDCSSFMNFVVGVKGGRAIPGYGAGQYTGKVHGPTAAQWAAWPGLATINAADVQAGDLACWTGHIGMAISNTQMISALNPGEGTKITSMAKGNGSGIFVRFGRLK